jgi:DUF4097 and DUF4098 domain-containing protein YvlB
MLAAIPLVLATVVGFQQRTDTTVAAPAGARLEVHNFAGSVRINTWDRAEVRVRAEHGSRDRVTIDVRGGLIRVQAERPRGRAGAIDYDLTIPHAMAVDVDGTESDVTVDSAGGDLRVESVDGDITVRNAGGAVSLTSVEGDIRLDGGRGTIRVTGVEGDVIIAGARGELTVETVEGDVTLDGVESANVDVSTVEGDITYRGTVEDGGVYRLTTHEGDVTLAVAPPLNATVSVSTFEGSFEAAPAFGLTLSQVRRGRRQNFVVGSGSARIELESFDGAIRLERR